jgi:hypothetical protein
MTTLTNLEQERAEKEIKKVVHELVQLTIDQRAINSRIKDLKARILEYTDINNLSDTSWGASGLNGAGSGCVEVYTDYKYSVNHDVPVEIKIAEDICSPDVAQECLKAKLIFTRVGKRTLMEGASKDLYSIADVTSKKKVVVQIQ